MNRKKRSRKSDNGTYLLFSNAMFGLVSEIIGNRILCVYGTLQSVLQTGEICMNFNFHQHQLIIMFFYSISRSIADISNATHTHTPHSVLFVEPGTAGWEFQMSVLLSGRWDFRPFVTVDDTSSTENRMNRQKYSSFWFNAEITWSCRLKTKLMNEGEAKCSINSPTTTSTTNENGKKNVGIMFRLL